MVSHPLSMRGALGSIPSVSIHVLCFLWAHAAQGSEAAAPDGPLKHREN